MRPNYLTLATLGIAALTLLGTMVATQIIRQNTENRSAALLPTSECHLNCVDYRKFVCSVRDKTGDPDCQRQGTYVCAQLSSCRPRPTPTPPTTCQPGAIQKTACTATQLELSCPGTRQRRCSSQGLWGSWTTCADNPLDDCFLTIPYPIIPPDSSACNYFNQNQTLPPTKQCAKVPMIGSIKCGEKDGETVYCCQEGQVFAHDGWGSFKTCCDPSRFYQLSDPAKQISIKGCCTRNLNNGICPDGQWVDSNHDGSIDWRDSLQPASPNTNLCIYGSSFSYPIDNTLYHYVCNANYSGYQLSSTTAL